MLRAGHRRKKDSGSKCGFPRRERATKLASATGKQAGIRETPGSRTADGGQSWTTCLAVLGPSVQLVTSQTKPNQTQTGLQTSSNVRSPNPHCICLSRYSGDGCCLSHETIFKTIAQDGTQHPVFKAYRQEDRVSCHYILWPPFILGVYLFFYYSRDRRKRRS